MLYWPVGGYAATICLPLILDASPIVLDHRSESLATELQLHGFSGRGGHDESSCPGSR